MTFGAIEMQSWHRRQARRRARVIVLCLAGSLVVHALGYAWIASMKPPAATRVPSGFMMVEQWPVYSLPAPGPEAGKPEGEHIPASGPAAKAPATSAPAPGSVTGVVQRRGILRALDALDAGPLARGIPGSLAAGDLPTGIPDAPRAQIAPGLVPARRGGAESGPAVLGDVETVSGGGGGGAGGLGGSPGGLSSIGFGTSEVRSTELDQGRLDAFVRARIGGLRACYETQLKLDQRRDGTMRVRFSILDSGEIADVVTAEDTLRSPAMEDCIVGIVRTWRTPFRPSRAVTVEYPFVFRPSRE